MNTATLLISCPDQKGLVATISNFLYTHGANILHADQHQDNDVGMFFMRVEWDLDGFELAEEALRDQFAPIAERFQMRWRLHYSAVKPKMAIFVSRYLHCLADLLYRHQIGELACAIPLIVSNHEDARALAEFHGVEFRHMPVNAATKGEVEREQVALLKERGVDVVILARYMQVLASSFVEAFEGRIINVHHSFLPAFSGARPYQAAFQRGVKLIGATSHYVTEVLDDGPIIEQDVVRISHRDQVSDLVQKGRDLERIVLSRAVKWHLEHRILRYANKTVVFD
ncbi:MAG: formyltetrahydrofolate deformylase [Acidobacteriales bacterium]|nr:formyltetrahydrofolate deformylase [Terriglobales bacterium]